MDTTGSEVNCLDAERVDASFIQNEMSYSAIHTPDNSGVTDNIYSIVLCVLVAVIFSAIDPKLLHWFLLPVILCGLIVTPDAIKWFRGYYDVFDIKGVFGVFGFHFFFLAPILVAFYNPVMKTDGVHEINDWRPWLGYMGGMNVLGLASLAAGYRFIFNRTGPVKKDYHVDYGKFGVIAIIAILISILCTIMVFIKMGGLAGIVAAKLDTDEWAWSGVGKYRIPMRCLPILVLFYLTIKKGEISRNQFFAGMLVLSLSMVLQFFAGGMSGARYVVVFFVIWVLCIIHHYWAAIKPKFLISMAFLLLLYSYVYDMYKKSDEDFLAMLRGETSFANVQYKAESTVGRLLIGDLSRADIQAWMLFRMTEMDFDFKYRYGLTYLNSPVWMIPQFMLPVRKGLDSYKVRAGTEYMMGYGVYQEGISWKRSLKLYGLAGEAMLNFGPLGIPPMFFIYGCVFGYYRKKTISMINNDLRWLFVPHVLILILLAMMSDSDNVFGYFWGAGVIPWTVIYMSAIKSSRETE